MKLATYHIRLAYTDEPSISLAELIKCLLNCLPLHLAVIPNWTPEYNEAVAEWGVIRVSANGLLHRVSYLLVLNVIYC
jgi:hypothetical protein